MTVKNIITGVFLLFTTIVAAQTQRVHIGEQLPNYTFPNLINPLVKQSSFEDFKGKILILDFWSQYCASCIESWPKLLELQKKFNDDIQIVLINVRDDEKTINEILKRRERLFGYKMNLPIATDKALDTMFKPQSLPHVIFADKNGKVQYIANGLFLSEETIQGMLENKKMFIPVKDDQSIPVTWSKPLFMNDNGGDGSTVTGSSIITKYFGGTAYSSFQALEKKGVSMGVIGNATLNQMLGILFGELSYDKYSAPATLPLSRIVFETPDSNKYLRKVNGNFRIDNVHTIQLLLNRMVPPIKIREMMIQDLARYFNLNFNWERRKKLCLIMKEYDDKIQLYQSGPRILNISHERFEVNNVSAEQVVKYLVSTKSAYSQSTSYPMIDETRFKENLGHMTFEVQSEDWKKLAKALQRYGLTIVLEERDIDVLVVRDGM